MKEARKTKAQLLSELEELRHRVGEFQESETELKRAEKTLQQSEERFRILVETTTDWFWEVDENAVYTYSSPKIRDILGYEPEEILGKTPFALMALEEADRVAHIFAPYATSRRPFNLLENTNVHKDGHLVVLETSGIPIFDVKGVFRGYRGIDRDITERKQAEQAIRASEMRLRTAIESLPFDFFIIDDNGRYVMQNSTCRDRWGDVIGKRTEDLEVDEDNLTLWLNNNRRAFAGEVIRGEVELKGRGGRGSFYNIIAPVTEGDQVREILGVNIDITERKRAEEELRQAHDEMEHKVKERTSELMETNEQLRREIENRKRVEERLRESEGYMKGILNAAPAGIGLVRRRELDWVSHRMCEMLGYSADELVGQSARIAYESDEEFERVGRVKYSEIQKQGVGAVETRFKRKDGSVLDVLLCSSAVDPGDLLKGTIFTALDITESKRADKTLRDSEEKYRLLVENLPSIVFKGYKDWSVEFFDEKVEVLIGRSMQEFNSKRIKWSDLVVEEDIAGARETFIKALKTDKSYVREYRIKAKSGGILWIQERAMIICDDKGEIDYVSGVFFDITERKRAEEALRESEHYFRSLLFNMHEDILVIDRDYRITDVNNTLLVTAGLKYEEVIGRHCYEISHGYNEPCERKGEDCMLRQVFETGKPGNCRHQHIQADGSKVWVDILLSPLRDENGNVTHVIEAIRDVTDLVEMQDVLRESEENFRALAENANDGILIAAGEEGVNVYANKRAAEITGYSVTELLEIGLHELVAPGEIKEVADRYKRRLAAKNVPGEYETKLVRQSREIFPVELSSARSVWKGEPASIIIIRDITNRKLAEEAVRKSEAELVKKSRHLEEVNAALKVLLKQREGDKADLEERFLANVKELVLPYVEKLKNSRLHSDQMTLVGILESNMKEIVSPFVTKLSSRFLSLTPTEIQVASLIKDGKSSKEIAALLNASENTVRSHRFHIRSKLGIKNKKVNFRSYLQSLQD
ncbi:MAG: PAS domain S-box protein [Deltaproteobacteria bacterium]